MRFNYTSILLVLLAISVIYSVSVMVLENDTYKESAIPNIGEQYGKTDDSPSTSHSDQMRSAVVSANSSAHKPVSSNINKKSLPQFMLVGLYIDAVETRSLALISFKGELYEYSLGDYILNTHMQLNAIQSNAIEVKFNDQIYIIELTEPNLLKDKMPSEIKTREELLNMTPQEIGSRPRIIEHLAILIPTPFIADGVLVKPGLNPALFAQAGFQEDDVLKTINGKSVTVENEFELIKEELKMAHTLEFTVMRKGRMITLYLDIPSEALKIK
ncbi:hypothetical protein ACOI22_13270 [Glaciecola sp. 2405UD65-10]|uniref:hypothetical protein n=1 Tax=Glaciecola sp. 2405UD65-10 TaxID=3397244 RepID=UPI003B591ACC